MKFTHIDKLQVESMGRVDRLKLINSISGFKSANLIGTIDASGNSNLAVISSVIHIGSSPALLGFVMRPPTVDRHTYDNIINSSSFTINHVHSKIAEKAHYTAVNFEREESEFEFCGLTEQYLQDISAPFVKESRMKMGMTLVDDLPIQANGCRLIIGQIDHIYIEGSPQREDGSIDLQALDTVCISGLDHYHRVDEGTAFPYPRREEMPKFERVKRKSDSVVYDEEKEQYNAALLPYASSVSGPAFTSDDLTLWKNQSTGKVSAHFKTRFEEIKKEYQDMVDQFSWNELVYSSKLSFEPVVGETYHLYTRENGERFMSLVPPGGWKMECLGSFFLNTDKMWVKIEEEKEE